MIKVKKLIILFIILGLLIGLYTIYMDLTDHRPEIKVQLPIYNNQVSATPIGENISITTRSFKINELEYYSDKYPHYSHVYGRNFYVGWIPFPLCRPLGTLDSGLAIFSRFALKDSQRYRLPEQQDLHLTSKFSPTVRTLNNPFEKGINFLAVTSGFLVSDNIEVMNINALNLNFEHTNHNPVTIEFILK